VLPSQKACETNPSREQKNEAVCAIRKLAEEIWHHFTHRNHLGEHKKSTLRTNKFVILFKKRCMQVRNRPYTFEKLKPGPGPTRNALPALHLCSALFPFPSPDG